KMFSAEAKVGIFVFLGILLLGFMSLKVGDFGLFREKGYNINVDFSNAAGLKEDASVRVAGVAVGKVKEITLKGKKARITLLINSGIVLEKDVKALIKTAGVLGEKYLEIVPGLSTELLTQGDHIVSTISPADLDNLLNQVTIIAEDVKDITASLRDSIGTKESSDNINEILRNVRITTELMRDVMDKNDEKIENLMTNLESISYNVDELIVRNDEKIDNFLTNFEELSGSLNGLIDKNDELISEMISNLNAFTSDLKNISEENREPFKEVIANLKNFSNDLSDKTPRITAQLETISKNLSLIVDENRDNVKEGIENINSASKDLKETLGSFNVVSKRIENSDGTIGKLISEDTTYDKINETLSGINDYLSQARKFKTILSFKSEFLSEPSEFKNYLTIKLQPNHDKYYFIELVDGPDGNSSTSDTTTTTDVGTSSEETTTTHEEVTRDKLEFSVGIAKRYYDLVLRGGIIESTGGFGLDYYLFEDSLAVSFEAYDFGNDDKAHLKAGATLNFMRHFFITAGYDDFIKENKDPSLYYGAGFSFTDDDLKFLLSSAPIPTK
ncbi:MlaD family protein, partial [Thermodesulfobacteriota bacterium]